MKSMTIEFHKPTGLWNVYDENGVFLVAFATEKMSDKFTKYGQISIYDFKL